MSETPDDEVWLHATSLGTHPIAKVVFLGSHRQIVFAREAQAVEQAPVFSADLTWPAVLLARLVTGSI